MPAFKNTFFYPSVNAGFVFTDAFKVQSDILSYGKLRASYARVGSDAPPYLLSNTFVKASYGNNVANFNFPYGSVPGFTLNSNIADSTLAPEFTTSYEAGLNLGFWKNRVSVDAAYFNTISTSQIFNVGIPLRPAIRQRRSTPAG
ncbi:TonB-dependent receptor domain-containing protein [Puia sp. P3]|uniref:TonB-dependent receptor domain-containing protein n=1 Tax=Puia sp. P3 TaxID=3423952 RepID=UPI003D66FA35